MANGWMIGVMVELAGEPKAVRHFFAVGGEDRSRAEWKAVDQALLIGPVATNPYRWPGARARDQRNLRQGDQRPGPQVQRGPPPRPPLARRWLPSETKAPE